ncbi:hypothetical protein [Paenibacillus rigui]|uniref:Lipoprotein n=1 Tax=Paenibacillus rigui TaxID=554312 RepID=A0A229UY63_9BACL|nr:hypothetical protein [Paenibacillus rigui]OXM88303.1 hypothetical protein CF651_00090 [Paenibacillus rigui]
MRLSIIILVLTTCIVMGAGCSKEKNVSTYPSSEQIRKFTVQNNLNVIDEKKIEDSFSVILYENDSEYGYYILYVASDGTLRNDRYYSFKSNSKLSISGQSSGHPFTVIVFNDMTLLEKANIIKFQYANGKSDVVQLDKKNKGLIHPILNGDTKSTVTLIEITDSDNNIIFKQ